MGRHAHPVTALAELGDLTHFDSPRHLMAFVGRVPVSIPADPASIEATISELKRKHGLGALRVRGRGRVELAVYLKALACNVKRMVRALGSPPAAIRPAMG